MKKFLTLYVVAMMAATVGVSTARAGTIAFWTFEEGIDGAPATIIPDVAGSSDGTAINSPVYVDGAASADGTTGLVLNGANQTVFVDSSNGGVLELTSDFTVSFGVYSDATAANGMAVFMGDEQFSRDPFYILLNSDGSVTYQLYSTSDQSNFIGAAAGTIDPNSYHEIAAVFDYDNVNGTDNFMYLYIDGLMVSSLNIGTEVPFYGNSDSNLWFGSVHNSFAYLDGTLSFVKITNDANPNAVADIPEPAALAVFGFGLVGLGLARRRKQACAA